MTEYFPRILEKIPARKTHTFPSSFPASVCVVFTLFHLPGSWDGKEGKARGKAVWMGCVAVPHLSSISVCRLSICLEIERSVSGACRSARQYVRLCGITARMQGRSRGGNPTVTDIPAGKASRHLPTASIPLLLPKSLR